MSITSTSTVARRLRGGALVPLATLLAAASLVAGSGADFTSHTANPGNLSASGTLTQTNSRDSAAIFTGTNLRPGDSVTGNVTITNTGTLAGTFSLTESSVVNQFSANVLRLKITDTTTGVVVFDGNFGAVATVGLGSLAAGEARSYQFVTTLAATAGNVDQGRSATATYEWDAVPTR